MKRNIMMILVALPILLGICACSTLPRYDDDRLMGYSYHDLSGVNFVMLFNKDGQYGGAFRSLGENEESRTINLSKEEFEKLWELISNLNLNPYEVMDDDEQINTLLNHVITRGGTNKGALDITTYAAPRNEAPESLRQWVEKVQSLAHDRNS